MYTYTLSTLHRVLTWNTLFIVRRIRNMNVFVAKRLVIKNAYTWWALIEPNDVIFPTSDYVKITRFYSILLTLATQCCADCDGNPLTSWGVQITWRLHQFRSFWHSLLTHFSSNCSTLIMRELRWKHYLATSREETWRSCDLHKVCCKIVSIILYWILMKINNHIRLTNKVVLVLLCCWVIAQQW